MTTFVNQTVTALVQKQVSSGTVTPPAAGAVPTANGAGGAAWALPAGGSGVSLRIDTAVDQTLYDDGVTRLAWASGAQQVTFRALAFPWYGATHASRWMRLTYNDGDADNLVQEVTGGSVGVNAVLPLFVSTGDTVPNPAFNQLNGYVSSRAAWSVWPTEASGAGAPLFEGVIAKSSAGYANISIRRLAAP